MSPNEHSSLPEREPLFDLFDLFSISVESVKGVDKITFHLSSSFSPSRFLSSPRWRTTGRASSVAVAGAGDLRLWLLRLSMAQGRGKRVGGERGSPHGRGDAMRRNSQGVCAPTGTGNGTLVRRACCRPKTLNPGFFSSLGAYAFLWWSGWTYISADESWMNECCPVKVCAWA